MLQEYRLRDNEGLALEASILLKLSVEFISVVLSAKREPVVYLESDVTRTHTCSGIIDVSS